MTFEQMIAKKKEKGYSCRQLSELSGVPFSTVQKIFSGITRNPRHETIDALEAVLYDSITPIQAKRAGYDIDELSAPMYLNDPGVAYGAESGGHTVEEVLAFPEDRRCELIDGVIYDMANPTKTHQLILGELHVQFKQCIKEHAKDCLVMLAPFGVRLDRDNKTLVEPDLIVVCSMEELLERYYDGAPSLAVEILSPSTRRRDMTIKLSKYRHAGVQEYWIIDPETREVMVYDLSSFSFPKIYGFRDDIPVIISKGKCTINLSEAVSYLI